MVYINSEDEQRKIISRVIENKTFQGLDVEIIIPFYGRHSLVTNLIQSIFNTVLSNRYLITLVDDGSSNRSFFSQIEKAKLTGVRYLRQEKNKGFGHSINYALDNPWVFKDNPSKVIPYVVILHSDVSFTSKNWLVNLGVCLETLKKQGVKMVSPLTNNPVEEMKLLYSPRPIDLDENIVLKGEEFLPLYCALCNRELFNHVRFIEKPYVSFEAKDFALKMKQKGFTQAVCKNSWVFHEGRGTIKTLDKNYKVQKILRKVKEDLNLSFN